MGGGWGGGDCGGGEGFGGGGGGERAENGFGVIIIITYRYIGCWHGSGVSVLGNKKQAKARDKDFLVRND